ncbi:MAG TPA: 4-alpha-glucanotransferase [Vicinamibacterales bacterium]
MKPRPLPGRAAGLVVPLFSLHSRRNWGIGDIADLAGLRGWLERAGLRAVQLLPVGTLPPGETSPYSALSAMAIDPIYIALDRVHDFRALGGEVRLPLADQIALRAAKNAPQIDYAAVRQAKWSALELSFSMFWEVDWIRTTARAGAFATFVSFEEWWLADYALYAALRAKHGHRPWTEWPEPLQRRDPDALDAARRELEKEILFHQYVQWLADEQWSEAREALGDVRLFGDFPFMVSADSADVWANQDLFRFDRHVGTPPDAFSESGQDWRLPAYRWDVLHEREYGWLRQRARRMSRLYDGYRIDHLVGFFRTYSRPLGETTGDFEPADEESQIALGERLLKLFLETGAQVTAEDLGSIPDFVRESLARFGVPGYKVLRWERDWRTDGQPFIPPSAYPAVSVATTSTHDITPLAVWWTEMTDDEREAFGRLLSADIAAERSFTPAVRDAVLELVYAAGSDLLLLPIQDVFGWPDRINTPATINEKNWRWRVPLAIEELETDGVALERADALRAMAARSGRLGEE